MLTLCNPLCFLINKFASTNAKILKSALIDFYDGDSLSTAKQQLLKDFDSVHKQVGFTTTTPHVPLRRDEIGRASCRERV